MAKDNKNPIDAKKKVIFSILLILIPVLFLLLVEGLLRIFNYGDNYRLFREHELYGKTYRMCNPDYGKKYFCFLPYTSPYPDLFLKDKPKNCFRIFVLGSSTVYGFPYEAGTRFSRILQERLQDTYTEKRIEVVNIAITAINSYTFQDIIDEIFPEKPDAILIYAGHNEFYGGMGIGSKDAFGQVRWLKLLHLKLMDFKTYQLIRSVIFGIKKAISRPGTQEFAETATLMERSAANRAIEYNSKIYRLTQACFEKNMGTVLKKAQRKKIPVFFSEVICNVRDLAPFASLRNGKYPPADKIFDRAVQYNNGGMFDSARVSYYYAKDLDGIRFRASEDINTIIQKLAGEYGSYFVPMKEIFEDNSPNGLIGNELLTEHVHPNIDGYFLMADAFYTSVLKSSLIGMPDSANIKKPDWYRVHWGFTSLDSLAADILIKKLKGGWPFQPDTVVNTFIRNYQPKSLIDSLAYQAVRYDDISMESAHKTLAKYYVIHNLPDKAVDEYRSIIKSEPFKLINYIEAGDILFDSKKYEDAITTYKQALKLTRDNYALSRIGETYALMSNYGPAIPYLEEVHAKLPEFRKRTVVSYLYDAYKNVGKTEAANKLFANNQDIFKEHKTSINKQEIILRLPPEVRKPIEQAIHLLQMGAPDPAYKLLLEANQINETSVANRFLGDILLVRKDRNALMYLKKVYYDYKTDADYLNTLCYASILFGDYLYAAKILPELKDLAPQNPNIPKYERAIAQNK
jgi:tetratricopeptide (TPR) repeat protein